MHVFLNYLGRFDILQGSALRLRPGLVNFVPALASHFCLNLPAEFTQPGLSPFSLHLIGVDFQDLIRRKMITFPCVIRTVDPECPSTPDGTPFPFLPSYDKRQFYVRCGGRKNRGRPAMRNAKPRPYINSLSVRPGATQSFVLSPRSWI